MKRHAEENLVLKDVIVREPRTFISNRSKPEDWVPVFNSKAGLGETQDGFKTLIWELADKDDQKRKIRLDWMVDRFFYGTCTISIVDILTTELYTKIGVEVGEILVKEFNYYPGPR